MKRVLYTWINSLRHLLLRYLGAPPIDNHHLGDRPTFEAVFGSSWEQLPVVMKKHYANRPYSRDRTIVDGTMNVECRWPLKLARPFYRLLGSVPLVTEYAVRCTVHFDSFPNSRAFGFHRHFWFVRRRYYSFRSRMLPVGGDKVIEIMRFGFCWCMRYQWRDNKVMLIHDGYGLFWFNRLFSLPITWLVGRGDAEEVALDDDRFAMKVAITHPLFGEMYSYSGTFTVTGEPA